MESAAMTGCAKRFHADARPEDMTPITECMQLLQQASGSSLLFVLLLHGLAYQ
jgi:hypothetical protein